MVGRVASFPFKFLVFSFFFSTCASIKKVFEVHAAEATAGHAHLEVSPCPVVCSSQCTLGGGACEWRMPKQAGAVRTVHSIPHHWTGRTLSSAKAKTSSPSIRSTACFEFECESTAGKPLTPSPRAKKISVVLWWTACLVLSSFLSLHQPRSLLLSASACSPPFILHTTILQIDSVPPG